MASVNKVTLLGNVGRDPEMRYLPSGQAAENFWSPHNAQFARDNGGTAIVLPSITMKTTNAHGRVGILMGWLASQTDMLSDDWRIVE